MNETIISEAQDYLTVEKGFSQNTVSAYHNDLYQLADFAEDEAANKGLPPTWEKPRAEPIHSVPLYSAPSALPVTKVVPAGPIS